MLIGLIPYDFAAILNDALRNAKLPKLYVEGSIPFARSKLVTSI